MSERTCRICGCTGKDCRRCIAATGAPCAWVGRDLCSACAVSGMLQIVRERARQVFVEGYTADHDREWTHGELRQAGACYWQHPNDRKPSALPSCNDQGERPPAAWPFGAEFWKPSPHRVLELRKAGALYLAEIERLFRIRRSTQARALMENAIEIGKEIDLIVHRKPSKRRTSTNPK